MPKKISRWVIKAGSQMVCSGGPLLIRAWMQQVNELRKRHNTEVIWVTSGAIATASDRIDFKKPIPAGTLVELIGTVHKIGNTSITIKVDIFLEKMDSEFREKVVSGLFTLVAVDKKGKPTPVVSYKT